MAESWKASLLDVAEGTRVTYGHGATYWSTVFARRDPRSLTVDDVQRAVAAATVSPRTMKGYRTALRGILDGVPVDPNPARSSLLRWPKADDDELNPVEADVLVAVLERVSKRLWLPLIVAEQTATRIGEIKSLAWGDVDERGCRLRLRRKSTKRRKSRFVPVSPWLMDVIAAALPREGPHTGAAGVPRLR